MSSFNFKRLLIHNFDVKRKSRTPDGKGGQTYTFPTIDNVTGRMSVAGAQARERFIGGKHAAEISHVFFSLTTANIQREDVLQGEGKTFRIIAIKEPSELEHHFEAACQEVDPPESNID